MPLNQDFLAALADDGLPLRPAQCDQLDAHCALIRRLAEEVSLVSKGDLLALEERHIADSLALAPYILDAAPLLHLDIGTGGGFPGLVLAIALPDREFLLLERSEKKAAFLQRATDELGLENTEICCDQFPQAVQHLPACTITARAIEKPTKFWPLILNWLPQGSTYLAQLSGDPPPTPKHLVLSEPTPRHTSPWRRGPLRLYHHP